MIFDTDVLIWALRGNGKAADAIDGAPLRQLSIVSCMELLQGARDKREMAAIRRFLLDFVTIPLSAEIGYRARLYMEEHSLRSRLGVSNALIAATAVEMRDSLCTANAKHYRILADLEIEAFRP